MMKLNKKFKILLICLLSALLLLTGCSAELIGEDRQVEIKIDGVYTSKEDVKNYLIEYEKLPSNYIKKKEAMELGWESKDGNLWDVADGKSIGGDNFGNREGLLPKEKRRKYFECDIDYAGGFRNGKRIVYSNDGLIYYTDDHYKNFEKLYGEE